MYVHQNGSFKRKEHSYLETIQVIRKGYDTDRKGGAFPIMLQQFRRAIGVAIVRGNAELRRGRLHYVRPTKEEAYHAADSHHSSNKWKWTGSGKSGWFKGNNDDGYN